MTTRQAIAMWRRIERGGDQMSLLEVLQAREVRVVREKLCSPVPALVRRQYRRIERAAAKAKAKRKAARIRALETVLADAKASDEDKRLARIELVTPRKEDL